MNWTRKDDQVGLSEKSRAVPKGAEREKDFPEVETYIFRGANETAQCGGMGSPSSSDPVDLRPDYGAVALGRWDERGPEGGSLV